MPTYYVCPDCGYKQRSEARKRIKCHRCGRSYKRSDARTVKKKTPGEEGTGFFRFKKED